MFQPGALKSLRPFTHKHLSGTCQMRHAIRFLGDEWLFGGCTMSLQEASQIKRQLWILKGPDSVVPHVNCLCKVFSGNVQTEPVRF